jgi:hypothetical protein
MSRLETRSPGPPVSAEFSKISSLARAEDAAPSATLLRPANSAPAGNKAEAVLNRLREKWPPEFRDGARCGFTKGHEGPRDPGGYPQGFQRWPLERRNAWFAGFNVGSRDRSRLSKAEPA